MSRITKQNHKYEIAFGHDHVFGMFLQIFEHGQEEPIEDRDQLSAGDLVEIAKLYGFTLTENDIMEM